MLQDRPGEGEVFLREALDIQREKLGTESPFTAEAEVYLGACLDRLGRESEAEPILCHAVATRERAFDPNGWQASQARAYFDAYHGAQGGWKKAATPANREIENLSRRLGARHPVTREVETVVARSSHHR